MSFILFALDRPRYHGNEIWDKMGDNSAPVKDNCALFAPTPYFGPRYPMVSFKSFPCQPPLPCNEFWDKIGYNSAPVKENFTLFAPIPPYFRARAIRWCHLNFSPGDRCCHGNEFWDKIHYNSVCVKDFCVYSGVFWDGPSNAANRIFPRATLVAMATKFGTYT